MNTYFRTDDEVPGDLVFEDTKFSSLTKNENVLKLVDPPEHDAFVSSNPGVCHYDKTERNYVTSDITEDLLNLREPPVIGNYDENIKVQRDEFFPFSKQLVEPISSKINSPRKSETNDDHGNYDGNIKEETDEIFMFSEQIVEPIFSKTNSPLKSESDFGSDKRSEKSLSDDGFELVKADEISTQIDEGDEVKKELEDLVLQEEILLSVEYEYPSYITVAGDEIVDTNSTNHNAVNLESIENCLDSIMRCDTINISEEKPCRKSLVHENESWMDLPSFIKVEHDICGKCMDIISWTHPLSSAAVFVTVIFVEFILLMEYSMVSLLAYSGIIFIVLSFMYKMAVNFQIIDSQTPMNCIMTFNNEDIEYCVNITLGWVHYLHKEIKSIAYMDSPRKNIKVFITLWFFTYIGQMFNLQSLIFIGSLLLFSMPLVHVRFKTDIDRLIDNIHTHIGGTIDKIKITFQGLSGCATK